MKKISFLILITSMVFSACGPQPASMQDETSSETYPITELVSNPLEHEGEVVTIEGIISHICRTSGDKMFIVQEDDEDFSIRVMLGDLTGKFTTDDEGKQISVTGLLNAWVQNIDQLESEEGHDHDHEHEEGHECSSTEEAAKRLQARGIDPDIRVFVDMISYDLK